MKLGENLVHNRKSIGIIGAGRIGEALTANLVKSSDEMGLEKVLIYSREKEAERVRGIIRQVSPMNSNLNIDRVEDLHELGEKCDIVVVVIGKKEGINKTREDLTGQYFHDIKEIMEGIGDSDCTVLMGTNPVTPNCLVANLYSQQRSPEIIGFTRLDYIRAKHILTGWLRREWKKDLLDTEVELDVLGPHGYGLLVTNIRIGSRGRRRHIYENEGLSLFFEDCDRRIEKLSEETAHYGKDAYTSTAPEGTPSFFAIQISETLSYILKGGKDTAAVKVNLSEICRSGLAMPTEPIYVSVPVTFDKGHPIIDPEFNLSNISQEYRKDLLNVLMGEEERIKNYLLSHKNGFSKLKNHYRL